MGEPHIKDRPTSLPELVTVCAWCRRWRDPRTGRYRPAEHPLPPTLRGYTHGICPGCAREVNKQT
jgi:hypothetical protein